MKQRRQERQEMPDEQSRQNRRARPGRQGLQNERIWPDSQGKISKTGLILIGSMVVCLLICLAVLIPRGGLGGGAEDLNDADTPDLKTVVEEGTPILIADKRSGTQALISAYEHGVIRSATIFLDDGTEKNIRSKEEVTELYRLLKNVVVTGDYDAESADGGAEASGEGDKNAGDAVILQFALEDEMPAEFAFIGDSIFVTDGDDNIFDGDTEGAREVLDGADADLGAAAYSVTGAEPLLKEIGKLTEKK